MNFKNYQFKSGGPSVTSRHDANSTRGILNLATRSSNANDQALSILLAGWTIYQFQGAIAVAAEDMCQVVEVVREEVAEVVMAVVLEAAVDLVMEPEAMAVRRRTRR